MVFFASGRNTSMEYLHLSSSVPSSSVHSLYSSVNLAIEDEPIWLLKPVYRETYLVLHAYFLYELQF